MGAFGPLKTESNARRLSILSGYGFPRVSFFLCASEARNVPRGISSWARIRARISCDAQVDREAHEPLVTLLAVLLVDALCLCADFGIDWKGPLRRVEGNEKFTVVIFVGVVEVGERAIYALLLFFDGRESTCRQSIRKK